MRARVGTITQARGRARRGPDSPVLLASATRALRALLHPRDSHRDTGEEGRPDIFSLSLLDFSSSLSLRLFFSSFRLSLDVVLFPLAFAPRDFNRAALRANRKINRHRSLHPRIYGPRERDSLYYHSRGIITREINDAYIPTHRRRSRDIPVSAV